MSSQGQEEVVLEAGQEDLQQAEMEGQAVQQTPKDPQDRPQAEAAAEVVMLMQGHPQAGRQEE
jgi:hypothetical protein